MRQQVHLGRDYKHTFRQGRGGEDLSAEEWVCQIMADGDVAPVEAGHHVYQEVALAGPEPFQALFVSSQPYLDVRRCCKVARWVYGHNGLDPGSDLGLLRDGQGETAAGGEAGDGDAVGVDVASQVFVVVQNRGDEGCDVVDRGGEGVPGGFSVVEGDHDSRVGIAEVVVPIIVEVWDSNDEPTTVYGEEAWQGVSLWIFVVVTLGEEDPGPPKQVSATRRCHDWVGT